MVPYRKPAPVGHKRVVRAEQGPYIGGMFYGRVEVGVVPWSYGHMHPCRQSVVQQMHRIVGRIRQHEPRSYLIADAVGDGFAQCDEIVQYRLAECMFEESPFAKKACFRSCTQVDDMVANGHARPGPAVPRVKNAERKVVDGKVGIFRYWKPGRHRERWFWKAQRMGGVRFAG